MQRQIHDGATNMTQQLPNEHLATEAKPEHQQWPLPSRRRFYDRPDFTGQRGWRPDVKTRHPMILTARIAEHDLIPLDLLRRKHFPPERNFLRAHLTVFYRLPGEYVDRILEHLRHTAAGKGAIAATVNGVRHLGAGVAFTVDSPDLNAVRHGLHRDFVPWLGFQDMQTWRPHITVQNKVSRSDAHRLHDELLSCFRPRDITITGLDLWRYLDGPWALEATVPLAD